MKKFLCALALTVFSSTALAGGSASNVTIVATESSATGYIYITLSSPLSGGPSCATSSTILVINGATAAGGQFASDALLKYALGKTMTAAGTGFCTLDSRYEDANYLSSTD